MMELKEYQKRSLKALSDYFAEVHRVRSASAAFALVTERVFGRPIPYRPVKELPGLPYVCLRIPTGGGKTLVAAHAAGLAAHDLLGADRPVILWLVPSDPVRAQTLAALRAPAHPYRRALEERLGACEVMDIVEALGASRARYASGAVVIVATMQAFRVHETEGRKVYEPNGALMDHFTGPEAEDRPEVERMENGSPVPSFANVLRLYRPIVIVDEAHNARTDLSFETLARFQPSCIIEFSATPATKKNPSNVLHSVSAAELKVEDMIKMPILLETHTDWKRLLTSAIARLNLLEVVARRERAITGEYIRPIMLIQAEANRGSDPITVDVVRRTLIEDHRIPEEQIARATGGKSELDGVDILSPSCPIRFVITIQQLREGWDCPTAYVLCSVAQSRSATAVEQLLGRIMRLPNAKKKTEPELNKAYAFAVSESFAQAAEELADGLVQNGFDKQEARDFITRAHADEEQEGLPLFDGLDYEPKQPKQVIVAVPILPDISKLPPTLAEKITVSEAERTITVRGTITEQESDALARAMDDPRGEEVAATVFERVQAGQNAAPARPKFFSVPLLAIRQGDLWEPFDEAHFKEVAWDLSKCDARLSEKEWSPLTSGGQRGVVTITDEGHTKYFMEDLRGQLTLLVDVDNWSEGDLAAWLDRTIPHPDVDPTSAGIFLTQVVLHLTRERRIPLAALVHDKYRLRQAVAKKINEHRQAAYEKEYQAVLFAQDAQVGVTPEVVFHFEPAVYPYRSIYRGPRSWNKHLYPVVADLEDGGEEFQCACFIDELPEIEVWVRNPSRPPAFWMQTSTDKTYPDFVCKLRDGRILVVEYKNAKDWSNADSVEKRILGKLWEERSEGRCLYIMPKGKDFEAIRAKVSQAVAAGT